MLELRDDAGLALETLRERLFVEGRCWQHLERNVTLEAELVRLIADGHAALAERLGVPAI